MSQVRTDAELPYARSAPVASIRPLALPLLFTAVLAAVSFTDSVQSNARLRWSVLGAAGALALWTAILSWSTRHSGRTLTFSVVLRKQHYLQACAQGSVLLYWGWYWHPVYDATALIVAQLLFGYAFDTLFNWSRRDEYALGFSVFPVIFSINLFLWFKPEWFYLQFLMVAAGFAAKDLIRWEKDGRHVHIFNPSSFTLALFSLALLATGTSSLTMGQEIATTQFYPRQMYLMLFLIGLPGQFFFGVTSMTMSAVVATYLFGLLYYAATGVYFFYDSYIPIAVFLGMHLLFTDPSTSPRTDLGRIIFGVLYGLSTVALYAALTRAGLPAFYDKLLQVPLLNLSIKVIDRAARSTLLRRFDPFDSLRSLTAGRLDLRHSPSRSRHVAYIFVWAIVFATMSAAGGVGDSHPGQWLPFWRQACAAGRTGACNYLANVETSFCDRGSAWACHDVDLLDATRAYSMEQSGRPTLDDFAIILKGSKGPITDRSPAALYALACKQGWPDTCDR